MRRPVAGRSFLISAAIILGGLVSHIAGSGERPPIGMESAQHSPPAAAPSGKIEWATLASGFEAAELKVNYNSAEVDSLSLVRIDPVQYSFSVHHSASGNKRLANWMSELGAVFVINGSYFDPYGSPSAPIVAGGVLKGPQTYDAKHGAFIASDTASDIVDLAGKDWRQVLADQKHALISFPLLIDQTGASRVSADPRKIASRSFVAKDDRGRIILGTTRNGFFSLANFAVFLKAAPLDLTMALNLDGGPLACQALALGTREHQFCGTTEVVVRGGETQLLKQDNGTQLTVLPIVLAVHPKR